MQCIMNSVHLDQSASVYVTPLSFVYANVENNSEKGHNRLCFISCAIFIKLDHVFWAW